MNESKSMLSGLNLAPLRDVLKRRRESLGMSMSDVRRLTGIHTSTLSRIEQGQISEPSWSDVLRLASVYGLSVESLAKVSGLQSDERKFVVSPPEFGSLWSELHEVTDDIAELSTVRGMVYATVTALVQSYMEGRDNLGDS